MGEVHDDLRHRVGLALGTALQQATVYEDGEEYVDWSEWHPCCDHPKCSAVQQPPGPCPCSGIPYPRPEILDAVMRVVQPAETEEQR